MIIAIDFDGVLIDHKNIPTRKDWWNDKPTEGSLDALKLLIKEHECYICTARQESEWPKVIDWLTDNGFPEIKVTNVKQPMTDIYFDDRAIRFTNWNDAYKYTT